MSGTQIEFTPEALREIDDAFERYFEESPPYGIAAILPEDLADPLGDGGAAPAAPLHSAVRHASAVARTTRGQAVKHSRFILQDYWLAEGSGLTQRAWSAVDGVAQGARNGDQSAGLSATIAPCHAPWLFRVSSRYPN